LLLKSQHSPPKKKSDPTLTKDVKRWEKASTTKKKLLKFFLMQSWIKREWGDL
jgi:hypothetical protein